MRSAPKLQLALDFVELQPAVSMADRVAAFVDSLEAGTPLIKACGLDALRALKKRWPEKALVADMKTADTGALEAEMAFGAGADAVTVLGLAPRETIAAAAKTAARWRGWLIIDTLGVTDIAALIDKLHGIPIGQLLVHAGIDQQKAGRSPFADLDAVRGLQLQAGLGVVGGLDAAQVRALAGYPEVECAVIGAAITRAPDPAAAAAVIRAALVALPANAAR